MISHTLYTANIYNQNPRVEVVDNFISPEICNHLIDLGKKDLKPSRVIKRKKEDDGYSEGRSSLNSWIAHDRTQFTKRLGNEISYMVDIPLENAEKFQLIHYAETQEYRPHFDAFDPETVGGQKALKRGGQRLLTAFLYLNTVEEGGGTIFPKLNFHVEAKQGRMVLFHNTLNGSDKRHPKSLHGGMPIIKGEKWAINLWFRESTFR